MPLNHDQELPTWTLQVPYSDKRVQIKSGLVFEMGLRDSRKAVGIVHLKEFSKSRVPLIEVLDVIDASFTYPKDLESWVRSKSQQHLVPPFMVNPAIFTKWNMAKRIGLIEPLRSSTDFVIGGDSAIFEPRIGFFLKKSDLKSNYTSLDRESIHSQREVLTHTGYLVRYGELADNPPYAVVFSTIYKPKNIDLFIAQALAIREGTSVPDIPYYDYLEERGELPQQEEEAQEDSSGVVLRIAELQDDADEVSLWVSVAPGTEVDTTVEDLGYEAYGYFWEGIATYLLQNNDETGVSADPIADGVSFTGTKETIQWLKAEFEKLFADRAALAATVGAAAGAGIDLKG